jgi:anti-anti-sigma factor
MNNGVRVTSGTVGAPSIAGELDLSTADAVARALADLSSSEEPLALDASDLCFVDLAGVRVLAAAARAHAGLELHGCSHEVRRMIDLAIGLGVDGVELVQPRPGRGAKAHNEELAERFARISGSLRVSKARAVRLCSRSETLRRDATRSVTACRARRAA